MQEAAEEGAMASQEPEMWMVEEAAAVAAAVSFSPPRIGSRSISHSTGSDTCENEEEEVSDAAKSGAILRKWPTLSRTAMAAMFRVRKGGLRALRRSAP